MIYYQVDAFTCRGKGGNPAGVVICDGEDFPETERMQSMAADFGLSETAFVIFGEDLVKLRYFTPKTEVRMCGHATIAAFKALKDAGLASPDQDYLCRNGDSEIVVKFSPHFISFETAHGRVRSTVKDPNSLQTVYSALDTPYDPVKIMPACNTFVNLDPMVVDNGLPILIVPINGVDRLNALTPNKALIREISKALGCYGYYAFAFEPKEHGVMAHCRGFFPLVGVDEEPATGIGAAALSFYLNGFGTQPAEREAIYYQGESMDRKSEIVTYIKGIGDDMKVLVGGDAEVVRRHEL